MNIESSRIKCGSYDHNKGYKKRNSFSSFNDPITSYGIILFSRNENGILFLLYQRRDNFEYMDFLRGLWQSESQLPSLFELMSYDERDRLRNYTFDELWNDLWVKHDSKIYREGYSMAKNK
jgi:hypothetical protein